MPAFHLDELITGALRWTIVLANVIGGFVIAASVVRGGFYFVVGLGSPPSAIGPDERIRLGLGRSLGLALEFQLAADIVGTSLDPDFREIATLAAIIVLRTTLNYFLGREIAEAEARTST